jgi:sec-independent protein translocase protein TatA
VSLIIRKESLTSMGNLGTPEIILIFLVILIFFGGKKIPEIAQSFGKGLREFKKASREIQEDIEKEIQVAPPSRPASPPAKIEQAVLSCPACTASNPASNKFCSECGAKLAA